MAQIKVVVKEPGKKAEVRIISKTLKGAQETVGGYIEQVSLRSDDALGKYPMICNEEGRFDGLIPNILTPELVGGDVVGTLFVVNVDDIGDFSSIPDEDIEGIIAELNRRSF